MDENIKNSEEKVEDIKESAEIFGVTSEYDADQIEEIRIAITEKLPDIDLYMKI